MNNIRLILAEHLHSDQMAEDLVDLLRPIVEQERRAAAETMRERCITTIEATSKEYSDNECDGLSNTELFVHRLKQISLDNDGGA